MMDMEQKQYDALFGIADEAIDNAFTKEHISSFLDVMWHCFTYPYFDQLLIWKQFPEATIVAGIRKWKNDGRMVKSDEKPIAVLLPFVKYIAGSAVPKRTAMGDIATDAQKVILYDKEPKYKSGFQIVPVFDISQMTGDKTICERDLTGLEDTLRSIGITISEEDADMPLSKPDGYAEENTFHIPSKIRNDSDRFNATLINLFVDWIVLMLRDPELPEEPVEHIDIVSMICRYCTQKYFMGKTNINPAIISIKTADYSHNEKRDIIRHSSEFLTKIIQYLTIQEFTFYDTAIANGLIDTPDVSDVTIIFQKAERCCDKSMAYSLSELSDKLLCASEDFLPELYEYKLKNKVIYTSPPTIVKKPVIE